jgi:hypothetical protein
MDPQYAWVFQAIMGIALAACAGLRVFLPLLVVGIAGRLDWIPLSSSFEWLAGWPALIVFGVAVVTEILADKIPLVDNFLDVVHTFVKPVAGAILVASVVTDLSPLQTTVLAIILGGGTSGAVQLTKAKIRLASSATTAGAGNPVISLAEDAGSLVGSVIALIVPILLILLMTGTFILLFLVARRIRRRTEAGPASG